MLIYLGHGHRMDCGNKGERKPARRAPSAVHMAKERDTISPSDPPGFAYLFPTAQPTTTPPERVADLDGLAAAMVDAAPVDDGNGTIPAVFTYLGQFVDHDITAGTDRDTALGKIEGDDLQPLDRDAVVAGLDNLRDGVLNLDSLYGGGQADLGPLAKIAGALRHPRFRAKMWIGTSADLGFGTVALPADPADDLLRLGRLLEGREPVITVEELESLPAGMRNNFLRPDGTVRVQKAVIGDGRNDENLIVAQLHLAFLRFHNKVVDVAHLHGGPIDDEDALFEWARTQVRWHYQWLVINEYLPRICDEQVLADVLATGAPLYARFLADNRLEALARMPIPLEFSVAAFRFGHSMVRASYDWNQFFGRPGQAGGAFLDRAEFRQMFQFTGNAPEPMPLPGGGEAPRLPSHWVADWSRLIGGDGARPDQMARKIDTRLAPDLFDMENEDGDPASIFRRLAARNLRRGYLLNIPSAQACLATIQEQTGTPLASLSASELGSGHTGNAVRAGDLDVETPLWFYILKEAEVMNGGERLGPLGTRIVAETIAGLVVHDPESYWHRPGSDAAARWHPSDGVRPAGEDVDSLAALLRAAALL